MPADPTTLPGPHLDPKPFGPFARGLGVGLAVPLLSFGFGGIGGGWGFLVAVAILAGTALAVQPSVKRAAGIVTGLGIWSAAFAAFLAYAMQDF